MLACVRVALRIVLRVAGPMTVFDLRAAGRVGMTLCLSASSNGRAMSALSAKLRTCMAVRMLARACAGLWASAADAGCGAAVLLRASSLVLSLCRRHADAGEKHGGAE